MSIDLALTDAAINCKRDDAVTVITLRSGVQLMGFLGSKGKADMDTRHMKTREGGWITFRTDEVVAVESRPR